MNFDKINELIIKSRELTFPVPGWEGCNFLNTTGYHQFLALYIREVRPKRCLELGRRHGNSLYSMSYFLPDSSVLDSYDLNMEGKVVDKPNVNVYSYDGNYTNLDLSKYDFVFIDINGGGFHEFNIYNQLIDQKFIGTSCWDDIGTQWCPDDSFWNKLPSDCKKKKTDLHGPNNFGIIIHE